MKTDPPYIVLYPVGPAKGIFYYLRALYRKLTLHALKKNNK